MGGMPLHEYLLGVGQKAAAAAAKKSADAEMARRRKAERAAMPAKSPKSKDNVLKPFKGKDMPEAAFLVHHAAAVNALRESGAPVTYESVFDESRRQRLDHWSGTSSHDMHDMPDTAFGVQHAAAVKALRDSGAPVNYGSVIREWMRSTLNHGPPAPYDSSKDTPADHARESCLRRTRMFKRLDEMFPGCGYLD